MKRTPLYTAISTACLIGLNATTVNAVDMNVTELHFAGPDVDPVDGIADNFPVDCSGGPTGGPDSVPAGNDCYGTTGMISDAAGDFGFFESVDPFFGSPWAAVGIAHFDGFDGSSSEDLNVAADEANITNGAIPATFGAFTQTITPNPDGNPATNDFTYSGTSFESTPGNTSPFSYTFTLTENQVAWGTLFNWNKNPGISVLAIFDCGASGTSCAPVNTLMGNGPFTGQGAVFKGTGSNFAPEANDDNAGAQEGVLTAISVLNNDVDRDDPASPPITSPAVPTISLPSATSAKGGTLTVNGGTIEYTSVGLTAPDTDTFTYDITDSSGLSSVTPATVNMTVDTFINTVPVAIDGAATIDEDGSVDILIGDVSSDADNPTQGQTITFTTVVAGTDGTVVANGADTKLTYTPDADFNGVDSFTFFVTDGIADSVALATVSVTINAINDAPVCAVPASLATADDTDLAVVGNDLVVDCTDVDGDTITFVPLSTASPVNVTLAEDGAGNITITPVAGATSGSFTFDATDGNGGIVTGAANIQIGTVFSNFTMLNSAGNTFGGTNDIEYTWDGTFNTDASDKTFGKMTIRTATPRAFEGFFWTADNIRVFGPGTYSFDTTCTTAQYNDTTTDITNCGGLLSSGQLEADRFITVTVPPGHVGGHIIFAWGQEATSSPCGVQNCDIDVVNVWEVGGVWDRHGGAVGTEFNKLYDGPAGTPPDPDTTWELVNIDVQSRDINGVAMVDGPFQGLSPTFNLGPASTTTIAPPVQITQGDTELGGSVLAGMSVLGLFTSLLALFGFRSVGRKD